MLRKATKKYLSVKIGSICLICFLFLFLTTSKSFSITLSQNSKTNYYIIIPTKVTANEKHAADVLSNYLKQITGAEFLIYADDRKESDSEILIGNTNRSIKNTINHPDGFSIITEKNKLLLNGGGGKGIVYAVYFFLEKFSGCRKYSSEAKVIPKNNSLTIPDDINILEIPKIDFREYFYTATVDDEYLEWHRLLKHHPDSSPSNWGMWVHTFTKLVPETIYFDLHPEYFAYYGGKRQPTQLCLSNDTVFDLLVKNLRIEMQKQPQAKYWSVSQNDNYGFCQCDKCKAIDSAEGSPSGSVIRFVNRVAEKFPDKIISTLAYQYTRSAPKITKPKDNVNIMFCSIECNRSKPIAEETGEGSFADDFENWSKLTHNILIWDYVVQFANYVSPFPNFKTLQPNLQFFSSHGVRDIFEQGSSRNWSDFGEMKAYIVSALLWNPDANIDSLYKDFANGFYGDAGESLLKYNQALEKNLDTENVFLDIYGNPVTPIRTWLKPKQVDEYNKFLLEAREKVKDDKTFSYRVERASLPLWYATLEQSKFFGTGERGIFEKDATGKWIVKPALKKSVDDFVAALKNHHITSLNENVIPPEKYLSDWHRIFSHGMIEHLAMDKNVSFQIPFSPKYPAKGATTLTDGVGGYDDYHYNWLGWEGEDMTATVDLGEIKNISNISCDFMEDQKSWIFFPSSVEFYFSEDGNKFSQLGNAALCDAPKPNKNFNTKTFYSNSEKENHKARFIKVVAHNLKTCPRWHIGAGYNCWIFCDEVVVK